ncbi:MAG: TetR/AcrR family transcriptional regulator [Chloroflexi bacterium]|nr:TetR/AcrR family transcriptional regulator [Chloroflexota bacterium]
MLQQDRAHARQRRILDAALRVFSRKGYRDTSVDEIAGESGTSKGGVYFHFPGKETILLHLLDRTVSRLRDKIDAAMAAHGDPIAKADAALLAVLRTFAKHRALARFFMVETLSAGREFQHRMAEVHAEFAAIIQHHLDDAVEQGVIEPIDTEMAGRAWFGALNEVIMNWVLLGTPESLEDSYTSLRPFLMRSVGAAVPSDPAEVAP